MVHRSNPAMAGLVPAIQDLRRLKVTPTSAVPKGAASWIVDSLATFVIMGGRDKPGHDVKEWINSDVDPF